MNIIFAGTPEFAVPALRALLQTQHRVVAVYTQPDRPSGRGQKIRPGPVKTLAIEHGLTVLQPQSFKNRVDVDRMKSLSADLMIVAAYGILLPEVILQTPGLGCINIHASLLPSWRGAAPIQRAILAGDRQTGITLMQMDAGLDTGDMLARAAIDIPPDSTSQALHDKLMNLGAELLLSKLDDIEKQKLSPQKQDQSQACYASKISKSEAEIDWNKSSQTLDREIRAYNPWPISYTSLKGQNVKIWGAEVVHQACSKLVGQVISHNREGLRVCCGSGVLSLIEIQFSGKKRSDVKQILNSRDLSDECFGC